MNDTFIEAFASEESLRVSSEKERSISEDCLRLLPEHCQSILRIGLGWEARSGFLNRNDWDLDASCVLVRNDGSHETVYYNRLQNKNKSVWHTGDHLTGEGRGDDEVIYVSLHALPSNVQTLVFTVNIFNATSRGQHFGRVSNAFIRMHSANGDELLECELGKNFDKETFVSFARLERDDEGWVLQPLGYGHGPVHSSSHAKRMDVAESLDSMGDLGCLSWGAFFLFSIWLMSLVYKPTLTDEYTFQILGGALLISGSCYFAYQRFVVRAMYKNFERLHQKHGDWIAKTALNRLKK